MIGRNEVVLSKGEIDGKKVVRTIERAPWNLQRILKNIYIDGKYIGADAIGKSSQEYEEYDALLRNQEAAA